MVYTRQISTPSKSRYVMTAMKQSTQTIMWTSGITSVSQKICFMPYLFSLYHMYIKYFNKSWFIFLNGFHVLNTAKHSFNKENSINVGASISLPSFSNVSFSDVDNAQIKPVFRGLCTTIVYSAAMISDLRYQANDNSMYSHPEFYNQSSRSGLITPTINNVSLRLCLNRCQSGY